MNLHDVCPDGTLVEQKSGIIIGNLLITYLTIDMVASLSVSFAYVQSIDRYWINLLAFLSREK